MNRHPAIRFGYADGPFGQLHYAEAGSAGAGSAGAGSALLCLHQTPRSWDEYAELIPLLSGRLRVVAMDTPGMGASAPLPPVRRRSRPTPTPPWPCSTTWGWTAPRCWATTPAA